MENLEYNRINKLLQDIMILETNDISKIERMSKYVQQPMKNVYVCLHPSAIVHYYHTHDFFEINYVYEGECINIIEGKRIYMKSKLLKKSSTMQTENKYKIL